VIRSSSGGGPGWVTILIGAIVLISLGLVRLLPPDSLTGRALTSLLQGVGPLRSDEPSVPRLTAIVLVVVSVAMITLGIVLLAMGH
jgi:hypothetical protein